MSLKYPIKQAVQFPEQTTVPKEQSENALFDILQGNMKDNANTFLNTTQIAAKLAEKAKLNITDGTVMKLGKALKKHGYLRLSK